MSKPTERPRRLSDHEVTPMDSAPPRRSLAQRAKLALQELLKPEPNSDFATEVGGNPRISYGVSAVQGWRPTMEDASVQLLSLHERWPSLSLFAVFDGHGGDAVSKLLKERLPKQLLCEWEELCVGCGIPDEMSLATEPSLIERCATQAFQHALMTLDAQLSAHEQVGSTAVMALLSPWHVVCANVGDSRAVLCRGAHALAISVDHKPSNAEEQARILKAGKSVVDGRIEYDLAVSRAVGDHMYKQREGLSAVEQAVTAWPDVRVVARQPEDEFVLLACDGVWDVLSPQQAVEFVRTCLQRGPPSMIGPKLTWPSVPSSGAEEEEGRAAAPRAQRRNSRSTCAAEEELPEGAPLDLGSLCELLLEHCLRLGSRDNLSAVVVKLQPEWVAGTTPAYRRRGSAKVQAGDGTGGEDGVDVRVGDK